MIGLVNLHQLVHDRLEGLVHSNTDLSSVGCIWQLIALLLIGSTPHYKKEKQQNPSIILVHHEKKLRTNGFVGTPGTHATRHRVNKQFQINYPADQADNAG